MQKDYVTFCLLSSFDFRIYLASASLGFAHVLEEAQNLRGYFGGLFRKCGMSAGGISLGLVQSFSVFQQLQVTFVH